MSSHTEALKFLTLLRYCSLNFQEALACLTNQLDFPIASCYNSHQVVFLSSFTPGITVGCRKEVHRASTTSRIPLCIRLFYQLSTCIKENNVWQPRQPKDRGIFQAGPLKRKVSLLQMNAFPGGNPYFLVCNTCWPCLAPLSWLPSSWVLIPTPQFSFPVSAQSFSSSS